ncbi:Piso0_000272 [Millerozyma farinosa CBS 7064]|uniref:Piso0_000272 protein n=1 Tax=Pichia sorbitophila (strain ATCC MYA-4447 / BCRC 22081 / CBS 7064 / NBRC 10061 / NRRL Y-12695) TaxID=559304 RepID=G8YTJ2_PICSO|nr:Piso0_000272 [Millerozyma farinosa CBS 7064]
MYLPFPNGNNNPEGNKSGSNSFRGNRGQPYAFTNNIPGTLTASALAPQMAHPLNAPSLPLPAYPSQPVQQKQEPYSRQQTQYQNQQQQMSQPHFQQQYQQFQQVHPQSQHLSQAQQSNVQQFQPNSQYHQSQHLPQEQLHQQFTQQTQAQNPSHVSPHHPHMQIQQSPPFQQQFSQQFHPNVQMSNTNISDGSDDIMPENLASKRKRKSQQTKFEDDLRLNKNVKNVFDTNDISKRLEKSPNIASKDQGISFETSRQLQMLQEIKKKRGRPKKLILDPISNQYIDSSHPNFKQLNKLLKSSSPPVTSQSHSSQAHIGSENGLSKLYDQPTYLRALDDDSVQELLRKKDKRGRPRKFPMEQTGLTIKGIRVNGTIKQKKRKDSIVIDANGQRIAKKERGRPRKLAKPENVHQPSAQIPGSQLPPPHLDSLVGKSRQQQGQVFSQNHLHAFSQFPQQSASGIDIKHTSLGPSNDV